MSIVKSYSKANDTTYVYEQDMKWNPQTRRPEGTRRLIGKIDPATGEIVPTGKRGRKKKEIDSTAQTDPLLIKQNQSLQSMVDSLRKQITDLTMENDNLKKERNELVKKLQRITDILNS